MNNSTEPVTNPSRIRDHLANERTFLAWLRTGIAMMGFGIVIARLRFEPVDEQVDYGVIRSSTLGIIFAAVGIIAVILATWRFIEVGKMIDEGRYRLSTLRLTLLALLTVLIGIGIVLNLAVRIPVR